ncbi:MAG: DUF6602 domain-containing protein [Candidatus Acidiferrales bacterium]
MREWSLSQLLAGLHDDIEQRLSIARKSFSHPGTKGNASEHVWLELLQNYLPQRYQAATAHVVDSLGQFSDQIDVVIFDRQYSPFIFKFEGQVIVPAESVYGVFEAKQVIDAEQVKYAQDKAESVRKLTRTSLPIPHAGGIFPPKPLPYILAGLMTLESGWNPPLGQPLLNSLISEPESRLDLGCVAAHGVFGFDEAGSYSLRPKGKPATAFLLELIALLQNSGTVPMIDVRAYARWLAS